MESSRREPVSAPSLGAQLESAVGGGGANPGPVDAIRQGQVRLETSEGRVASAGQPSTELAGPLHEVSNALTVVLGWLAEARSLSVEPALTRALDIAYRHAKRGHTVARQAIGAPVQEEGAARSALSVAQDAVHAAMPQAKDKAVRFELIEPSADTCLAGAGAALQVLVNLLLNAVAFSPPGGEIKISCESDADGVRIDVQDQGRGVPESVRDLIFAGGQSLRPGGAGIGLAHSKALAEQHGGELGLLPQEEGKGALFRLFWPKSEQPSQTACDAPEREGIAGMRVLVLEDDAAVLDMVELGLASRGVEVTSVTSLAELNELQPAAEPPDAMLMDLSPLGDKPSEALSVFRARFGSVPIILISGTSVDAASDLPLSGLVEKPFELGELYSALGALRQQVERAAAPASGAA